MTHEAPPILKELLHRHAERILANTVNHPYYNVNLCVVDLCDLLLDYADYASSRPKEPVSA